jgi:outer membrane protein TolC
MSRTACRSGERNAESLARAVSSNLGLSGGVCLAIRRSEIAVAALALTALVLSLAPPSAQAQQSSSSLGGVDTLPPAAQGDYASSVPERPVSGVLQLSLEDAIARGLKQNLGALLRGEDIHSAQGARWQQLSALLPNVTTSSYVDGSQVDLAEFGFTFNLRNVGVSIPTVVGPFGYFDSRAYVSQSLFDWKAINSVHAASETIKSAQSSYQDARDLVVLAVGYLYLQTIADQARIETADAQVKSAEAVYNQASDQVHAGTSPAIDALRAHVELQSRQQQLIQAKNSFAIQKLRLARVIGLAPAQQFELTDTSPYQPFAGLSVEEALQHAYRSRSDYQAALADVRAGEYTRKAAEAGYLPSLVLNGDYGLAGTIPQLMTHGVFDVKGTLTIPIFLGGRVKGDVLAAEARLRQSRDRAENLRAQIDADVRTALFNVESAEQLVAVSRSNIDLADQTLAQSQDRFRAGVTDTVEVVQAQEAVASAHEDYISSLYQDNYAKISLARALGVAEQGVKDYFKGK